MDTKILLLICMVIVFAVTLGGALIPLKLFGKKNATAEQIKKSERICSLCNCLAGGVFLATCFLGLIPSARKKFQQVFKETNHETLYPVCEAVVVAGFFLILLLEQTITACQHKKQTKGHDYMPLKEVKSGHDKKDDLSKQRLIDDEEEDEEEEIYASSESKLMSNSGGKKSVHESNSSNHHHGHSHSGHTGTQGHSHDGHGHTHLGDINQTSLLHSLILLLALSVHSIFEGVALGLQDDIGQIVYLLIAMVAHESLAAFALGMSLLKNHVTLRPFIVYSVVFASMIPVGAAIGIGIQSIHSHAAGVSSAVMQAIAAGIFIFVTFFEILNHEFDSGNDRILKVFCAMGGYAVLAVLELFG